MGRGRAKAKQQKVARELKYSSHYTDSAMRCSRGTRPARTSDRARTSGPTTLSDSADSRRRTGEPTICCAARPAGPLSLANPLSPVGSAPAGLIGGRRSRRRRDAVAVVAPPRPTARPGRPRRRDAGQRVLDPLAPATHRDHADAEVEASAPAPRAATHPSPPISSKIGCGRQVDAVDDRLDAGRQHPGQVAGQPAAGDVGEGVRPGLGGQRQAVQGVDAGRGRAARRPGCGRRARRACRPAASPACSSSTWRTSE